MGLWQWRNRMRVHQSSWHLHEIGDHAKDLVREFFDAHKPISPLPGSSRRVRWVPPSLGCYKANVDAAMFEALDCTGIGSSFGIMKGVSLLPLVNMFASLNLWRWQRPWQ